LNATPTGTNWFPDKYLPALKTASDAYGKSLVAVYTFNDDNNSNPWIYQELGNRPIQILPRLQISIAPDIRPLRPSAALLLHV